MADAVYIAEIDLRTRGNFGIPGIDRAMGGLSERFVRGRREAVGLTDSLISGLGKAAHVVDNVASSVARVGMHGGMVGLAGAVGLAAYGVMGLNKELETTKISLGAIYTAQGIKTDLPGGIELARGNVLEMRRLAAKLPGEFEDLLNIMTTTAIPAFHAGVGEKQQLQLSSKLMAAGVVAKLPLDMVAREAAQLIEGRSGAHNVLGMRMMGLHGASAQEFNKLSAPERMARLNTELDKYAGAIDTFSGSFEGISSTFLDSGKEWLRATTEPAFFRVRDLLSDANTWLSENDALVSSWADYVGSNLVVALDGAVDSAKEIGPLLLNGFRGAVDVLKEYGPAIKDVGMGVAGVVKDVLSQPEMIAALALISGRTRGLGVVGLAFAGTSGLTDARSSSFLSRPLGAPGSFEGMGLSLSQLGELRQQRENALNTDGSMAGIQLGSRGASWAGSRPTIGREESWMRQMFSFDAGRQSESWWLRPIGSDQMDQREQQLSMLEINDVLRSFAASAESGMESYTSSIDRAREAMAQETAMRVEAFNSLTWLEQQVQLLTGSALEADTAIRDMAFAAYSAAFALRDAGNAKSDEIGKDAQDVANLHGMNLALQALGVGQGGKKEDKVEKKAAKGGTRIQKVEIVVTTNREPTRVARLVKDEIVKLSKLSSPHVPNYARG
ncbi:MAG TPA: hypothetical protein VHO25_15525 [Polyangiaceae bacterium]|nr:hypothetical protein [Polyangiaceae bacterium]